MLRCAYNAYHVLSRSMRGASSSSINFSASMLAWTCKIDGRARTATSHNDWSRGEGGVVVFAWASRTTRFQFQTLPCLPCRHLTESVPHAEHVQPRSAKKWSGEPLKAAVKIQTRLCHRLFASFVDASTRSPEEVSCTPSKPGKRVEHSRYALAAAGRGRHAI